jgi:hypothetical protein
MDEELLSYAWERKFFMAVSEGNVDEVKMRGNPSLVGHCSKMVQCELKRIEYEICTGLSLGCRAMIEGGIEPSAAYSLRDSYLRRLELCKTGNEMIALSVESFVCFTTLVHENKKKRSIPLTDIVKHYIEANIMDNWTLDDIAQGIAINKSYLCHVFKKSEGMTVMAYPPKTPRSRGKPFAKKYRPYCVNRRRALFCGSGALWTLV